MPTTSNGVEETLTYIECDCGHRFQVRVGVTDEINMEATSKQAIAHYRSCNKAKEPKKLREDSDETRSLLSNMEETFNKKGWKET